jgi:hypothetical protein
MKKRMHIEHGIITTKTMNSDLRRFRLKFWSTGVDPKLKEYALPFRNSSEAYVYIKDNMGIPITVSEMKEPPPLPKRFKK